MAVDMRLSLREHSPHPVALGADAKIAVMARDDFPGVFDDIVVMHDRYGVHRAMQFGAGQVSPFDHTLFIDADCFVLSDPDVLWPDPDAPAIVMTGERLGPDVDRLHHGFSTRDLIHRFGLDIYLKNNGGVFYFRGPEGRDLLEECLRVYVEEVLPKLSVGPMGRLGIGLRSMLGGFLGAELSFAVVGGREGFGTFPDPGPMYWPPELAVFDPREPWKPICHWLGPMTRDALRFLLDEAERRRSEAGVASVGGAHWIEEDRKLRKQTPVV